MGLKMKKGVNLKEEWEKHKASKPKQYLEHADGKVEDITSEERQKEANYIFAKGLLDDLITDDWTEKRYYELKEDYLQGKVTLESWNKYISHKGKTLISESIKFEIAQQLLAKDDDSATELISENIQKNNKFYATKNDVKSELWVYQNGIYKPNGQTFVKELCRLFLEKAHTGQRTNKVIEKIHADNYIDEDDFFNKQSENIDEIPVINGILNIKTRELSPFTHEKVFFNKLNVEYKPNSKCTAIEKFFKSVLKSEDDAKVIYELFGFSLLKEYRYEKAFMFVGDGRNGKGKTLSLFKRFFGMDSCSAIGLTDMDRKSTSLHELFGKFINLAGDLAETSLKHTGDFKGLCGRDPISAKRKFLSDLKFVNYAKLLFAANELPRVYDSSIGFWSRWILLEFPYKFVGTEEMSNATEKEKIYFKTRDESIIDKISTPEELNGLLILALDGLDTLHKQGDFSYSKGTAEVKDYWVRKSDSFMAFCMDCIETHDNSQIKKDDIRKQFFKYTRKHKLKGASDKDIKATLEGQYGAVDKQIGQFEDRTRVWDGVKFKDDWLNDKISTEGNYGK